MCVSLKQVGELTSGRVLKGVTRGGKLTYRIAKGMIDRIVVFFKTDGVLKTLATNIKTWSKNVGKAALDMLKSIGTGLKILGKACVAIWKVRTHHTQTWLASPPCGFPRLTGLLPAGLAQDQEKHDGGSESSQSRRHAGRSQGCQSYGQVHDQIPCHHWLRQNVSFDVVLAF